MGGGGGPTSSTTYTSNLPEYARPYFEHLMDRTEAESNRPYDTYGGQRVAGFNADQNTSFGMTRDIANRGAPELGMARGVAGAATNAALGTTAYTPGSFQSGYAAREFQGGYQPQDFRSDYRASNYASSPISAREISSRDIASRDFDQNAVSSYMSPYVQNVVDRQKAGAIRDFAEGQGARNQSAIASGAFGGYRNAISRGVAERGLNEQLSNIEAQGLQSAYDRASQQFNTDAGRRLQADTTNVGSSIAAQQANQQAGLQAQTATEASRQFGASFGDQSRRAASQMRLSAQQMSDDARRFGSQLGLRSQELGDQSAVRAAEMGLRADQMTEEARQRAAGIQQAGAGIGLQGAGLFSQLGAADQGLALQRAQALQGSGDRQQALEQKQQDLDYSDFVNQRDFDRQQLNFLSSIMRGVPVQVQSEVSNFQNANPMNQMLGLGVAGLGAYNQYMR